MPVRIEPWNDDSCLSVESMFGPADHWTIEQGRGGWRPPSDGEYWSRCLVVFDDDEPVAVASAFHPRLHPAREWAYVEVIPHRRRSGLGTRALSALKDALPKTSKPLRAKVLVGSPASFMAERVQMASIQRTRQVRVNVPADLASAGTVRDLKPADPGGIAAWRAWYIQGHDWDPPAPQPDQFWAEMAADTEHVIGIEVDDTITGIGHTYTEQGTRWFVGGALDHRPETAAALLVAAQNQQPGTPLRIELDDWMTDVSAVIATLDHTVIEEAHIVVEPAST